MSTASLTWYTNSFISVVTDGFHLAIDPIRTQTLKTWLNMPAGWSRPCEGHPDAVLVTHGHYDHFDPLYLNALHRRRPFFLAMQSGMRRADRLDPSITPMIIKAGERLTVGPLDVLAIPCLHEMERPIRFGRVPCVGYVISGSRTVCVLGDTVYRDFRPLLDGRKIDLLVFPAGGRTILSLFKTHLHDSDSFRIIDEIRPRRVTPVHWRSRRLVPLLLPEMNDVPALGRRVEGRLGIPFHTLDPGGRMEF